jgi:lysozyme
MSTSDKGLLALMVREGVALQAYLDTANPPVWTIGLGHTAAAGDPKPVKGMRISLAGALSLFRQDIKAYERDVLSAVKVPLAQHEFDALVSFHYNTGGIKRAKLTSLLNAGDRAGAANAFMGWVTPASIRSRRESEMRQFQTGDYGDLSTVLVYRGVNSKSQPAQAERVSTEGLLG